jgi:phage tail sheath gpL-like
VTTSINVLGLANSRKTPGVYLAVILGGLASSAGSQVKKILVMGNKITTALTGASPAFTIPANASPADILSPDEAITHFGQGSEAHRMIKRIFEQFPDATVTAVTSAESGGAKATGVLTFAATATAAFTVRFRLGDKVIDVPVASAAIGSAIAEDCAEAILAEPDLGMTAQYQAVYADGTLTLTAKHTGPRGNLQVIYAAFVNSAGVETPITTASTISPGATTTGILSGVATLESSYYLSGGTTQDSFALALASVASLKFDRYAVACSDAANLDLVAAQMDSMAGVTSQKRQQYVAACNVTLGDAITLARGRNDKRGQIAWAYNSLTPPEEIAAQVAAGRLIGDAFAGGSLVGEATDPACNLDGLELRSVLAQVFVAERPTSTEIESALGNGLTVLEPSGANPGKMAVVRSITSCCLDSNSQPNFANLDTTTVTVPDYVADDLQGDLAAVYHGKKVKADTSDGAPPLSPSVVTPNCIRDRIAFKLKGYEEAAIISDVDANMSLLAVALSSTVAGRVDCEIPCEPTQGLHICAGNVRQVG